MEYIELVELLIATLQQDDYEIFKASVRTIGNILSGDAKHCDTFMKYGLIDALLIGWSKYQNIDVDKEMCWMISNIAANPNVYTVLAILNNEALINKIAKCL